MIAETSTNTAPPLAITKKSMDKSMTLDVKATEVQSSIPEDLVGEEINEQSTSLVVSDQEKKVEERENTQEEQPKKNGNASEKETLKEQKEEKRVEDENKCQQSGNAEGDNSDNVERGISEINQEIDEEKCAKSDTKERKSEIEPVQTTKLRGKSKATGRILGGWL